MSSAALDFDPTAPEFAARRFALLDEVRETGSAVPLPALGVWAVTRDADVRAVLADPATYASAEAFSGANHLSPAARRHYDTDRPLFRCVPINADRPLHTRLRRPLVAAFTPRRVRELAEPTATEVADLVRDLQDDLARGPVDLLVALARPLPARTICRLVGIPLSDEARLLAWSEAFVVLQIPTLPDAAQVGAAQGLADFDAYIRRLVTGEERPEPGLIADIAAARAAGENDLTDDEFVGTVASVVFAGQDTTVGTLSNALTRLLQDRPTWGGLAAGTLDPDPVATESLRLDTSVMGLYRRATRDIRIGDSDVPAGTTLWVAFGAANRDPRVHPDPAQFRAGRVEPDLTFGHGIHVCVGTALARLQVAAVLAALPAAEPDLELVAAAPEIPHHALRSTVAVPARRAAR